MLFNQREAFISAMAAQTLLPGDVVSPGLLPISGKQKSLTLGPGLNFTPPSTIQATAAGSLSVDHKKNALWLETGRGGKVCDSLLLLREMLTLYQYAPAMGDLVIATVHHSSVDFYHCAITPYTTLATLPQLSFEGATKKTRPILVFGSLVYARVALASKHMEPELECIHPNTGRGEGLGELKGGMLFDISPSMARRLMMSKPRDDGGVAILEELGEKGLRFEIAVGRNGKVWINSDDVKSTITIGRALQETDTRNLTIDQQEKLVRSLLKAS